MNPRSSLYLLAALLVMSLVVYFAERPNSVSKAESIEHPSGSRVLEMAPEDILQVQVKRDFYNSYTLSRGADGAWRIIDPSSEPAGEANVGKLLESLANLTVITTIDLPQDDSERHRQYGLWKPSLEVTVSRANRSDTVMFGAQSEEGTGVYCALAGHDKVYVIPKGLLPGLSQDLSVYRQSQAAP